MDKGCYYIEDSVYERQNRGWFLWVGNMSSCRLWLLNECWWKYIHGFQTNFDTCCLPEMRVYEHISAYNKSWAVPWAGRPWRVQHTLFRSSLFGKSHHLGRAELRPRSTAHAGSNVAFKIIFNLFSLPHFSAATLFAFVTKTWLQSAHKTLNRYLFISVDLDTQNWYLNFSMYFSTICIRLWAAKSRNWRALR